MYKLIKTIGFKKFLTTEMPAFGIALIIAEFIYKFGSFILECGSFLATWYFISWMGDRFYFSKRKSIH